MGHAVASWARKAFSVTRSSPVAGEWRYQEPNNLIKRIKRIGFGFRNFENHRIRALLYAGKPNWRVLGSIVVR